jgi:hypothetical protein
MQPTGDDFKPRRDGWFEHAGTWGEVTVGTVIADVNSRTKRWEIIDVAHATGQIPPMKTLWMRAREQTSGEVFSVEPRTKTAKVIILTRDPADTTTPPVTPASDTEAIWALVEGLGAQLMASVDTATGEVTCPDYTYDSHLEGHGAIYRGLLEHMRVCHDWSERAGDPSLDLAGAITLHAQMHDPTKAVGKGGFPHRHVPEDLNLIIGRKGR